MESEYPFHMLLLAYSFVMISYRAYYMGYVDASGETVPKLEEGIILRRLRYSLGLPFILGVVAYLLNPNWMRWSQWSDFPDALRWVGVIILAGSVFLYGWTHRYLGKNFTDTVYVRKESTLIQGGPYHWVRHPMYVSALMAAIGIFLVTANWFLGVVGILLMFIIMRWRTPIEEQKLIERYGEAYHRYAERTGRFFPKLW
ncbi:MAG: hypothetical protein K940chlam7_00669 [Chlamydiae bacterium]|nr:hypothetical protein [Chlamydiota bacterium]